MGIFDRLRLTAGLGITLAMFAGVPAHADAEPLVSLAHHVVGAELHVSPPELSIPKNVPGSITAELLTSDGARLSQLERLAHGTHVEGTLRGPGFPAYRLLGIPNEPLDLPPLPLPGEYQIDDLRLVDTATGEILMFASPARVAVDVFSEVLISHVESRPLSLEEIQQRGIVIDADSFSAVEFQASFVVEGRTQVIRFPVVTPKARESTEIIPEAELQARLVEAERINRTLASSITAPSGLDIPGFSMEVQGLNFQIAGGTGLDQLGERLPAIPGLLVIPGNIGFLNQFFSVQVFTANGAPPGSNISVHDLTAEISFPPGNDRLPGTVDDPLVPARIGPDALTETVIAVRAPGDDHQLGTPDDEARLQPGGLGQAEFLVEGKKAGLHVLDIRLRGLIDGAGSREIPIEGRASGSVLVRNPKFSIAFSHPRTIRTGEEYTASLTILNTSEVPADLVTVNLHRASISGAALIEGQSETISLGTIAPGQSRTAEYRLRAQQTGYIRFANLTGDDGLTGRFDMTMGVDERGVALDANVIGYPHWVEYLPEGLRRGADRVLGQALSVSTAATLPPGVRKIAADIVEQRVIELAEAGQRLHYGDSPERVYFDLLLDWHGGRAASLGFDQILRETDAGAEFGAALIATHESSTLSTAHEWARARGPDVAGRSEPWGVAATADQEIGARVIVAGLATGADATGGELRREAQLTESGVYGGQSGWLVLIYDPRSREGELEIEFRVPAGHLGGDVSWSNIGSDGTGTAIQFSASGDPLRPICYHYFPQRDPDTIAVDQGCEQISTGAISVSPATITEAAPALISATQDLEVRVLRPFPNCGGPTFTRFDRPIPYGNYGTLVAVLFSKPMAAAAIEREDAFLLDNGVRTNGVSLQKGGRVALVNFRNGVRTGLERILSIHGITDARGNLAGPTAMIVDAAAAAGVSVDGRVVGVDGQPAPGVPVTLTMHDTFSGPRGCVNVDVRVSQVITGEEGEFVFDFVSAGLDYSVAATDTRGLDQDAVEFLLRASPEGELDPEEVARLATEPGALSAFRALFDADDLQGAIAVATGVDRAVFRDSIATSSARVGSIVPVVLRFRGRGTVEGTVYQSDALTPVAGAAINLFPDSSSRELGRGVFSDNNGRFTFAGVPLGPFTLDAGTPEGLRRIVAGRLDGASEHIDIVLSEAVVPTGRVEGYVYESNGLTPHANARIHLLDSSHASVGHAVADADGFYAVEAVPAQIVELIAASFDGRRVSSRPGISVQSGETAVASISLASTATVLGRVEFANGTGAAGALVSGGEALATTDASGSFVLTGVPSGRRPITAGLDVDLSRGIEFVRIGSTIVDVLPGADNYAVIRLEPRGRIIGTVYNQAGGEVPEVRVAIPDDSGFFWTTADQSGRFAFDNMPLGPYLISAPSPPIAELDAALAAIRTQNEEEIRAALGEFAAVYNSGRSTGPVPENYGFTTTRIELDGETVTADIRYLPEGTVSGVVRNELGIPISATVSLMGIAPDGTGRPTFDLVGSVNSDPATGIFSIPGLRHGRFTISAVSPFYPRPVTHSGETAPPTYSADGIVLQFGAQPTTARLTGVVLLDGAPAGPGVLVSIDLAPNYQIQTDAEGIFDAGDVPARGYLIDVLDPTSGRVAHASALVVAGQDTHLTIPLLASNGTLTVEVTEANGAPAAGASIDLRRAGRPPREAQLTANAVGSATFSGLLEGRYSITACRSTGQTRLCASARADVPGDHAVETQLVLQGAGIVEGDYFEADGVTPVAHAQISIGTTAYATTDENGAFLAEGIPLGLHQILGRNAVTGRAASAEAHLVTADQVVHVTLREAQLGELVGRVIGSDGASVVPAAPVSLTPSDRLFPPVLVTADPAGQFNFPGVPPGPFTLSAHHPISSAEGGTATGEMPLSGGTVVQDVVFEPRADATITVLGPSGAPVPNVEVTLGGTVDTDLLGQARFTRLRLGEHTVSARDRAIGRTHSAGRARFTIVAPGETGVEVRLAGVGTVGTRVIDAAGAPVEGASITLEMIDPLRGRESTLALSDNDGRHTFGDVALGEVRASAVFGAVAGAARGTLTGDGEHIELLVQLGPSATVRGVLVRANGLDPIPNNEIFVSYGPALNRDVARTRTSTAGEFLFAGIPIGEFLLEADVPRFGVLYREGVIPAGVNDLDLGAVGLDELLPTVLEILPANGDSAVPVDAVVEVTFSEEMDPFYPQAGAVYLASAAGRAPVTSSWLDASTLRIDPVAELASETQYTLVISAGELRTGAASGPIGPLDTSHRPLAAPFIATFTTADSVSPLIESFTPADGAEQVALDAAVRIAFNEPIEPGSVQIELIGPDPNVTGSTSVILNQQVAVFTPDELLEPNTTYLARLIDARDRGNNFPANLPVEHTFATIDTLGPEISSVAFQVPLVSGAQVAAHVALAEPEINPQVQMTSDLVNYRFSAVNSLVVPFTVPAAGAFTVWARAIDRFGNFGPFHEASFTAAENLPPSVTITPLLTARTGQAYRFRIDAQDDSAIARLTAAIDGAIEASAERLDADELTLEGTIPESIGPGQSIIVRAEAVDNSGSVTAADILTLPVQDGFPPQLAISGPSSPIDAGVTATFDVTATDAFGVTSLVFTASGLVSSSQGGSLASPASSHTASFSIDIPADAPAHGMVAMSFVVSDAAGNTRSIPRALRIADHVPPSVVTVDPSDGATNVQLLPIVRVDFSEPVLNVTQATFYLESGGTTVPTELTVIGGGTAAELVPFEPLAPGATYYVHLTSAIIDRGDHALPAQTTSFSTTGGGGPRLVAARPADGSTNIALDTFIEYDFDRPVYLQSIDPSDLDLRVPGSTLDIYVTVSLENSDRTVRFTPLFYPLQPGATYRARLSPSITDLAGNPICDELGQPFVEHVVEFTMTRVDVVAVPGIDRLVAGTNARVRAVPESTTTNIAATTWTVDEYLAGTPGGAPELDLYVPPTASTVSVSAFIEVAGGGEYVLPPRELIAVPRDGDEDNDGYSNALEATAGTNPFVHDSATDPDQDGLTNGQELELGTNPNNPDSDGDGTLDGQDPDRFDANRAPSAGLRQADDASLLFSGHADTLVLDASARIQAPFTLELWVKPTNSAPILDYGTGSPLRLEYDANTQTFSFGITTAGEGAGLWTSPHTSAAQTWHHLALTYDGARFRAYVDGRPAVDQARTGDIPFAPGENFIVPAAFNGYVDEIRLWNVARTIETIREQHGRTASAGAPGLHAYWPLPAGGVHTAQPNAPADGLFHGNPTVVMEGSAATLDLRGFDFDGEPISIVFTQLPAHGRLHVWPGPSPVLGPEIAGGATFAGSTQRVVYVAEPNYLGQDTIELHATDGTRASPAATIVLQAPSPKDWVGTGSSWATASNWNPAGAPGPSDAITIPPLTPAIALPGGFEAIRIGTLSLGTSSIIDLSNRTLIISGHVANDGLIQGPGSVILGGNPSITGDEPAPQFSVRGSFPSVSLGGAILDGDLIVSSVDIHPAARVDLGAHQLQSQYGLSVVNQNGGGLIMAHPDASIELGEFFWLLCDAPENTFEAGVLTVTGIFQVDNFSSQPCFAAGAAHDTIIAGVSAAIYFADPVVDHFGDLEIAADAYVAIYSDVRVIGELRIPPSATVDQSYGGIIRAQTCDYQATSIIGPQPECGP